MTLPFSSQYFNGTAGLTQGGWILQATELRCGMTYGTMMLYGGGQWGAAPGASFTASLNTTGGGQMVVSAVASGTLYVGVTVYGASVPSGTLITAQVSGTTGGVGTYSVSTSSTVASEAMASGEGPLGLGNGGQIYGQYAPPNGPLAIECQLPVSESAVEAMVCADFNGSWLVCAGVANASGYARVWTRNDTVRTWQPTQIWESPTNAPVQVRSLGAYTDSAAGVTYVFAGVDDGTGAGGIFRGTYNSAVPGCLVWNSTPELAISATNQGVALPAQLAIRVMSFCAGANGSGGTSLFATIGIQVWERIDGAHPTWQLVWTKPTVANEVTQSGLRGLTACGSDLLVFPEGTDWGVVLLNPASGFAATWQYNLQNLQDELGTGFGVSYVIGPYNAMASVQIGSTWYGLIGIGVQVSAYPAGTPIYTPAGSSGSWLAQSHYLVRNGTNVALYAMTQQANPTAAVRFMVPLGSTYVMAGGFDFENSTEAAEYGWGAYDTQSNAVSGT